MGTDKLKSEFIFIQKPFFRPIIPLTLGDYIALQQTDSGMNGQMDGQTDVQRNRVMDKNKDVRTDGHG